ncbi:hypothetical protein Pelo_4511 [Pelomyxa schiedti]|nr:hypothetical protein Pelo_4511 [Pelomyxa schiedti]
MKSAMEFLDEIASEMRETIKRSAEKQTELGYNNPPPEKVADILGVSAVILQYCSLRRRTHPESVSLCLLCGAIVCPGSKCCGPEGYEHAQVCSGGEGVCLMLKYSVCFVVSRYWTGTTNTLFLDQYGEPVDQAPVRCDITRA